MRTNETFFVLVIAALWVAITALGSAGFWFPALLLSVALIALQTILGAAHQGRVSRRLVFGLVVPWAILWTAAFVLARFYALKLAVLPPAFTILGMHPSFAWIVILYWFAGSVVVCAAYLLLADEWLSKQQWEEFRTRITALNGESRDD